MKKVISYLLFALQLFLAAIASAAGDNDSMQTCLDMQDKASPEKALECYNRVAQAQSARSESKKTQKSPVKVQNRGLADEWSPSIAPLNVPLTIYKQNYILFYSYSSQPNNAPTSPNIDSQVPVSYPLDNKDMKFQISLKGHLLGVNKQALWFGYTQLSFWQFYDTKHSTPFRESNYEPELIYSYRPEKLSLGSGVTASFLNAGLVHQSNGQSLPRSRGWTRVYIQAGLERDFGANGRLALLPRVWKRLSLGNPDIARYLGHGDIELRYCYGQGVYSFIKKLHSHELDLAFPIPKLFGVQIMDTNLQVQYFNGYGESLIDYNQNHHTFGLGLSVPLE